MDAVGTASATSSPVRAAGGVVWRTGAADTVEVAVVHRPRYDDWSLPKGKLRRHEHPLVGACREVEEETGVHPRAVARLPTVDYLVRVGGAVVDKVVDYWTMAVVGYRGAPHGVEVDGVEVDGVEVDAVSWLGVDAALGRLSYDHDARVVSAFAQLPALRGPVVVIRPAAVRRRGWSGPDAEQPLGNAGAGRARQLARLLACYAPVDLVSAPASRCIQTLEPLSQRLGIPIRVDAAVAAAVAAVAGGGDAGATDARLVELARGAGPVVVCGPGDPGGDAPGAGWALAFDGDRLATVDELS